MRIDRRRFTLAAAAVGATLSAAPKARAAAPLAVDDGGFVSINGVEQWIGLRGYDAKNPIMLFLHGGPGMGITHGTPAFDAWERHFTVAYWDMPHGGATHAHNLGKDQGPISGERYVADAIAVAEHLRRRMGVGKIVLFGISYGTRVGADAIRLRPDLFSAYVGTAQAVSGSRGIRLGYDTALSMARQRGDAPAIEALTKVGPPPYARLDDWLVRQAYCNAPGLPPSARELAAASALGELARANPIRPAPSVPAGLPAFDLYGQFMAVQGVTFRESMTWEADSLGRRFQVPVFVFHGTDDLNTPFALAKEWVAGIDAPHKVFAPIEGAGHNTIPFHGELLALLRAHVLPNLKA